MSTQLAFVMVPLTAAEMCAERLELVINALEDAAAWRREYMEDEASADLYEAFAAELEGEMQ